MEIKRYYLFLLLLRKGLTLVPLKRKNKSNLYTENKILSKFEKNHKKSLLDYAKLNQFSMVLQLDHPHS